MTSKTFRRFRDQSRRVELKMRIYGEWQDRMGKLNLINKQIRELNEMAAPLRKITKSSLAEKYGVDDKFVKNAIYN